MSVIDSDGLLDVRGLRTVFDTRDGRVCAVDGVDVSVRRGECLGVVGESGSGKSVTFASIMGLIKAPGRIDAGDIYFDGQNLRELSTKQMRAIRGREIAMTMQDALTALNPALTVGEQLGEMMIAHDQSLPRSKRARNLRVEEKSIEILELVGIPSAKDRLTQYPHEFSGGMRQRIMIAISLASHPRLLIADEPTTALDVTIQAQVLELISELRSKLGMSVVLITHDLGVVSEYCDRVMVMYAGQVVEEGSTEDIIRNPQHPYTQGLLNSIPRISKRGEPIQPIEGQVPDLIDLPAQCRFYSRCNRKSEGCQKYISMTTLPGDRKVRCVLVEEAVYD